VGGGSITYANTMLVPQNSVWDSGSWAGLADWKAQMPRHYETALRMLGVVENRILGPADHFLKQAADAAGVGHTFYRTNVAVFEPPEGEAGGKTYPDPYFGGEGPARCTCIACGGCMVGCRYNAKNSLDKNYLYLAEKHGAQVFDETRVVDVKPLCGKPPTAARGTKCAPRIPSAFWPSIPAASPAGAWSLPLRRWAAWTCFSA
jgi:cholesterol oxidase